MGENTKTVTQVSVPAFNTQPLKRKASSDAADPTGSQRYSLMYAEKIENESEIWF